MLETATRLIGSNTYHVRQLGSGEARKLLVRLTKAMGPVLGALLADMDTPPPEAPRPPKAPEEGEDGEVHPDPEPPALVGQAAMVKRLQDVNLRAIGSALTSLATQLREEDLEYLCRVMGGATEVEAGEGKLLPLTLQRQELHFRGGHLAEMFKWLAFGLEVQYWDFFAAFGAANPAQDAEEKGT